MKVDQNTAEKINLIKRNIGVSYNNYDSGKRATPILISISCALCAIVSVAVVATQGGTISIAALALFSLLTLIFAAVHFSHSNKQKYMDASKEFTDRIKIQDMTISLEPIAQKKETRQKIDKDQKRLEELRVHKNKA